MTEKSLPLNLTTIKKIAAGNDLLETSFYDTPGQINSFLQDADILLENLDQVLSITSRTSSLVPSDQQQEEHRKSMQPPPNSLPIIHPSTTIDRSFTESPESIPDSPSLSETPKPKFLTVMEAVEPTPPPPAAALLTKPEPAWKKIAARLSEEQIKSKIGPENTSDAASAAMNSSLSRNPGLKQSSRPTWLFNLWKIDETEEEVVEQEEDMDNRILILPTELDLSKSSFISPIVASPSKPIVVPPPKKQNTVHLKESISNENIKQQQSQQLIQHHQKLQSGLSHLQPVLLKQKGNSMPLSPGRLSTPELLQNVQKKLVKLALLDHDDDVDFSVPTPTSRQLISAPQLGLSFAPAAEVPAETTINNIINNNSKNNDSIKRTNILEDSYTSDMSFPTSFQSANDLLNRIQTTRNKFINYKSDAAKRQSSSSSSSTFYGKRLPEVKNQVLVEDESSPLINATTVGDEDQPSLNYTITSLDPSRILDHADIVERTLTAVIAAPTSVNNNTTTSTITSMSRSSIGLKHKGGARPPPFELYSSSKSSSSSFLRNVNDEDKSHRRSFDTSFYLNTSGSSSNGSGGTNTRSFWKSARIKSMAVKGFKASSADSAHHEGRRSLDIL